MMPPWWKAIFLPFLAPLASCGFFDLLNPGPADVDKNTTWQTHLGTGDGDVARSLQATSDGGFLFLGTLGGNTSESDVWLVKTDGTGAEQWSRTYGGASGDTGSCLRPSPDGGYILVGSTRSDILSDWDVYLVKTKADGSKEWEKTFGGSAEDHGWSVECISDGYLIIGSKASSGAGNKDAYLIKTDKDGNWVWERTFGGLYADEGYAVSQAGDGGFVIAGYTQASFNGDDNAWLIKTDANGNLEWQQVFGIIATSLADIPGCLEQGKEVLLTSDGGYLLAGYTHSLGAGDFDAWLIKTDSMGNETWNRTIGGGSMDQAEAVVQTADGGYALAGMSRSWAFKQAWLAKTDSTGKLEWDKHFGGDNEEWAYDLQQTADGGFILAGSTSSHGGDMAYLVYFKPWTEAP